MIRFSQRASWHWFWAGCLALASCLVPSTAQAGFTIRVGNGDGQATPWGAPIVAGTTGVVVPVFIRADSALDTLESYFVAMEFGGGNPGFGIPTGFSNFDADFSTAGFGDTANQASKFNSSLAPGLNTVFPGLVNFDFRVTNTSTNPVVSTSTFTKLFDLKFDVGTNAAPGIYDVNFVINTAPIQAGSLTSFSAPGAVAIPLSSITAQQGSFQVTAVPEPSSMALLGVSGLGLYAFRRFRKRQTA